MPKKVTPAPKKVKPQPKKKVKAEDSWPFQYVQKGHWKPKQYS